SGMTEADLARPVVVITDFETEKLEFEIYTYGEQTVVVPVQEDIAKSGVHKLAEENIQKEFMNYTSRAEVKCVSDNKCIVKVPERDIARIIGKEGKTINELERKIGMSIDVQELSEVDAKKTDKKEIPYQSTIKKNSLMIDMGIKMQNKDCAIYIGDDFFLSAKAGSTGVIKIKKNNPIGKQLIKAINSGRAIRVFV
ncbi:MAG: KH domain-containing protein, partial [Nanoarchaeota archaeon]